MDQHYLNLIPEVRYGSMLSPHAHRIDATPNAKVVFLYCRHGAIDTVVIVSTKGHHVLTTGFTQIGQKLPSRLSTAEQIVEPQELDDPKQLSTSARKLTGGNSIKLTLRLVLITSQKCFTSDFRGRQVPYRSSLMSSRRVVFRFYRIHKPTHLIALRG